MRHLTNSGYKATSIQHKAFNDALTIPIILIGIEQIADALTIHGKIIRTARYASDEFSQFFKRMNFKTGHIIQRPVRNESAPIGIVLKVIKEETYRTIEKQVIGEYRGIIRE